MGRVVLAAGLSLLAGYVDAVGYLELGGVFVSFMSGNSTVLGVAAGEGVGARTWLAGLLVAGFVAGVMGGTWVGRLGRRAPVVLVAVAAVLAGAAAVHGAGFAAAAGVLVALAMGAENTVFQSRGKPGVGLTYMTGTLVRVGQHLAEGTWRAAVPDVVMWAGMVVGAGLGALAYGRFGFQGLWAATAVLLGMAALVRRGVQ